MRFLQIVSACLLLASEAAARSGRSTKHVGRKIPEKPWSQRSVEHWTEDRVKRQSDSTIIPQNANTTKFAVNGTAIPEVDFDIGESYAGLLPISSAANASQLYFWFFPTSNPEGTDDIVIWFNGGPGCSSLEGFLQENGPFLWQYGTFKPYKNPWTWVNLANMIWVEQPVGTGFSKGEQTATSSAEAAEEFLGFYKNFVDTFGLHNKKVYITGESYAGFYVPYTAYAMLERNDTTYYDLQGTLFYDPVIGDQVVQTDVVTMPFVDHWAELFNLNQTYLDHLHERNDECGYTDYFNKYLTYPPSGVLPTPSPNSGNCSIWEDVLLAVFYTNPCFDEYAIATTCPLLWDVLGYPGSFTYLPEGATIYFNRTDVQKAINAPVGLWEECSSSSLDPEASGDGGSPFVSYDVLPSVIERSKRTIIAHGNLDYVLINNGTLLAIQNMTWGGEQGFQAPPSDDFFVPYHDEASLSTLAASGIMGKTTTERGLTYVDVWLSGHMVPQYQPSVAYRQLEFLLGRVDSLTSFEPFTTNNVPQPGKNASAEVSYGMSSSQALRTDAFKGRPGRENIVY